LLGFFKSEFEAHSSIIAKNYYLNFKNRKKEVKLKIFLYHYKGANKDVQNFSGSTICLKSYFVQEILEYQNTIAICYG
jgi:hypothetical protein